MTDNTRLTADEHDDLRMSIPMLMSGGLSAADRDRVHGHLLTCDECRIELAEVAAMPGLLGLLRPSFDAPPPGELPPAGLREGLLVEVARRRRSSRLFTVFALAASTVTLIVAGALGLFVSQSTAADPAPVLAAMVPTALAQGATGSIAAVDKSWGSAVTVQVGGVAQGTILKLVAKGDDGRSEAVAWWTVNQDGKVTCEGSTSIRRQGLSGLEVQTEDGRALLTSSV